MAEVQSPYEGASYFDPVVGEMVYYQNGSWMTQGAIDNISGNNPGSGTLLPYDSGSSYQADPVLTGKYDTAINQTQAALDRQDELRESGYSGIEANYSNALNALLLGKNRATEGYNQGKLQTGQEYVGAKNTIGSQAGGLLNGLLRLLGSRGAGGGSAARQVAPGLVARGATLQRGEVGRTNAQNNQALDTNYNNYLVDYDNEVASAGNQKTTQRQQLENQINTNRADLLQTLAQLNEAKGTPQASQGYLDQANQLLNTASNYTTPAINYNVKAYSAPSLASYQTPPKVTPQYQGQSQTNDYYSPYLSALLGKKQQGAGVV